MSIRSCHTRPLPSLSIGPFPNYTDRYIVVSCNKFFVVIVLGSGGVVLVSSDREFNPFGKPPRVFLSSPRVHPGPVCKVGTSDSSSWRG